MPAIGNEDLSGSSICVCLALQTDDDVLGPIDVLYNA
jgi:hypothetical protein